MVQLLLGLEWNILVRQVRPFYIVTTYYIQFNFLNTAIAPIKNKNLDKYRNDSAKEKKIFFKTITFNFFKHILFSFFSLWILFNVD